MPTRKIYAFGDADAPSEESYRIASCPTSGSRVNRAAVEMSQMLVTRGGWRTAPLHVQLNSEIVVTT